MNFALFREALAHAVDRTIPNAYPVTYGDGTLLGYAGTQLRAPVRLGEIDPRFFALLIAVEDRRFGQHMGVDVRAIARASLQNLRTRRVVEGASTLAQQLLKNSLLRDVPRGRRKVLELALAPVLTGLLGRPWILEAYASAVYMGSGLFGVRSASLAFLQKEPAVLSWSEAAALAGLPKAPEAYAFYRPNPAARARRDRVLTRGARLGLLTDHELSVALREPMPNCRTMSASAADFLRRLPTQFSAGRPDFVITTIDRETQAAAGRVASRFAPLGFCALAAVDVTNGAVVASVTRWPSPTEGHDVALAGSLSPGSTVKPFVLATAIARGYCLECPFRSEPVTLPTSAGSWTVTNWRNATYGYPSLRDATLLSDNTVYARLITEVGHIHAAALMARCGLPTEPSPGPTLALGVLSGGVNAVTMAASYSSFAREGEHVRPRFASEIHHADGQVELVHAAAARVMEREVAESVREVLSELVHLQLPGRDGREEGFGKTGTPADGTTGWFVGVAGDIATAVIVGGSQSRSPKKAQQAADAWRAFNDELRRFRAVSGVTR